MLKKFEVTNFKGFKDTVCFDLTAREYSYNDDLVQNGIVSKALLYGKNGIGKSNIGFAIFDIIRHLTDSEKMPFKYLSNYINLESDKDIAIFKYCFEIENDEIVYEYGKKAPENLVFEKLTCNGELLIEYEFFGEKKYIKEGIGGELNFDLLVDNTLSIIKYIYKNTPTNTVPAITELVKFCEGMLWYRSLSEGNAYAGFQNGSKNLTEILYETGKLGEFQQFLGENGVYYSLEYIPINGERVLMIDFKNGKMAPFLEIASTGTMALLLFYVWSLSLVNVSFLFIDEFDAFFHYEAAASVLQQIRKYTNLQCVVTSHNTYLMSNKITRPDCCFVMTHNKISNLSSCTEKEIREAHNLEKMYINGVFNE